MIFNIILGYLAIGFFSVLIGPLATMLKKEHEKVLKDGNRGIKPVLFRLTMSVITGLFWPLFVPMAWKELRRPKPLLQELIEINSMMAALNESGTDLDEIPGGVGEFGWSRDNPVPCSSIMASRAYLNSLASTDGRRLEFSRVGSFQSQHIKMPIDGYRVSAEGADLGTLYISPYQKKNSNKAPQGLTMQVGA